MKGFSLVFLFAYIGVTWVLGLQSNTVVDLNEKDFEKVVVKSGKPTVVKFFIPNCGHCQKLAPTWNQLGELYSSQHSNITIAKFDCDKFKKTHVQYNIRGFPTIKLFDGKTNEPKEYNGDRELESLQKWIEAETNIKPKPSKAPSSKVVELTDTNFDVVVNGDKNVLVKFYAPWCGHCKQLAPIYEELANDFEHEDDVIIAKLNADSNGKETTKKHDIGGYPTLKFFKKGSREGKQYAGSRSKALLIDYLNAEAGTYRKDGGGLNDKAGLISAADKELGQLLKGDNNTLKIVLVKIRELLKDSSEPYAFYYLRVLEKLNANEGYAEKEFNRLQGVLKDAGSLSKKKVDELTSKINILGRFNAGKKPEVKDEL